MNRRLIIRMLGALLLIGYLGASFMPRLSSDGALVLLYICYSVLAGLGTGMAFNALMANIAPWFPEHMVIDLRSLKAKPLPGSFEELADPVYHGELCLIGSQGKPDPLLPLFLYAKEGKSGVKQVLNNVKTVAGPSVTIRQIGRTGNRYGSVFLMPSLFADICRKCSNAMVFCPSTGALAEPILIFWRQDAPPEERTLLAQFLEENECHAVMHAAKFPLASHAYGDDIPIDEWCIAKKLYPERYSIQV